MKLTNEQEDLLDLMYEMTITEQGVNVTYDAERSKALIEENNLLPDDNTKEQFTNASIAFGLCAEAQRRNLVKALAFAFLRPSDVEFLARFFHRLSNSQINEVKNKIQDEH